MAPASRSACRSSGCGNWTPCLRSPNCSNTWKPCVGTPPPMTTKSKWRGSSWINRKARASRKSTYRRATCLWWSAERRIGTGISFKTESTCLRSATTVTSTLIWTTSASARKLATARSSAWSRIPGTTRVSAPRWMTRKSRIWTSRSRPIPSMGWWG